MLKRIAPLILLAAWIPQAQAFPPCPVQPMEYGPPLDGPTMLSSSATSTALTDPWFKASYQFVGDPIIIGQISSGNAADSGTNPNTGKCRDSDGLPDRDGLPILSSHASPGALHLNPRYAPRSGFGIVELPYLPQVATHDLQVEYRLAFTVDNSRLQTANDWLDVVQLDFFHNGSAGMKYSNAVSSIYRVRKTQSVAGDAALQIIESRSAPDGVSSRPPVRDTVVAVIPLQLQNGNKSPIELRWTQNAKQRISDSGAHDGYDIHVVFEVLGPNNQVVYTAQLPAQWASMLSMGLLDYNVADASAYKDDAMEFSNMTLSAEQKY